MLYTYRRSFAHFELILSIAPYSMPIFFKRDRRLIQNEEKTLIQEITTSNSPDAVDKSFRNKHSDESRQLGEIL